MDFSERKPAMMKLLQEMVETESPSYDKEAVDKMGSIVIRETKKLGAEIEIVHLKEFGDNIIARWGEGEDGILLIGHMDTVFPLGTLEMQPFYEKYGKVFGPGTLDMKSGLVIMLTAVAELQERGEMPNRPITMLFNTDEEMGSYESRKLIEKEAKRYRKIHSQSTRKSRPLRRGAQKRVKCHRRTFSSNCQNPTTHRL